MPGLRGGMTRLLAVPALVAASTYAFAASNTVPTSAAGEGASSISGYTISNIDYTLNSTNPANVDQVEFDLDGANGADTLYGGDGDDTLDVGKRDDACFGGAGNDTFKKCETWVQ